MRVAGTSYGVSLLWILAAVTANESMAGFSAHNGLPSLVIGTEHEPEKVQHALEHVREGFNGELPQCLNLLEGDLLKTLPAANIPDRSIDALLLDIWSPLTLPTLKLMITKLRIGAVVFADNTIYGVERHRPLLGFIRDPANGFESSTLPHDGGFEFCVFKGTG